MRPSYSGGLLETLPVKQKSRVIKTLGLMEKQHKAKTTTDTIKSEAIGFAIIINLYIPSR